MLSLRVLLAAALAVATLAGCSKKKDGTPVPTADPSQAEALVTQANASLGAVIAGMIAGPDPQRPNDIDFSQPYALYQQALSADPGNRDARFGVAVLGLASLTTDAAINDAFDDWSAFLESQIPFEAPPTPGPLGVPVRFGSARETLRLPFERLPLAQLSLARGSLNGAPPTLSGVQNILETRALPKLTQALAYLQIVASDPNFRFIVTPAMQGDPGADPVEIDRTDILALRAGCGVLAGLCHLAVAYDVSFASYDSAGLVTAFTPGSGWMALRTGGATHLSATQVSILGAADDVEASLNSLAAESDNQDDDLIKITPNEFTSAAAESLRVYVGHARSAMSSGFRILGDWDRNSSTPDVVLNIQTSAFFNNPVGDWKSLLPAYTAGAVRRPFHVQYGYDYQLVPLQVTIGSPGYYSAYSNRYVSPGGTSEYGYGDAVILTPMQSLLDDRFLAMQSNPDWAGEYYGNASFSGTLGSGTQMISVSLSESYTLSAAEVFVPTITWNAADFGQWTWPDPTLHGLLPQMSSTSQLLGLFGMTAGDWQRTLVLDWTGSGAPQP